MTPLRCRYLPKSSLSLPPFFRLLQAILRTKYAIQQESTVSGIVTNRLPDHAFCRKWGGVRKGVFLATYPHENTMHITTIELLCRTAGLNIRLQNAADKHCY